jgi:hypothetical protein
MGIMIGGVVLFCLVDSLLGFVCSNDYFASTLFFVLCLFVEDPRKLQIPMSEKKHANTCRRDEELYLFLHYDLIRNLHHYFDLILLFLLDVWVLEVAYHMAISIILVVQPFLWFILPHHQLFVCFGLGVFSQTSPLIY